MKGGVNIDSGTSSTNWFMCNIKLKFCEIFQIINTHGRFAIAFLPLTTRLSTELFEAVFNKKSSG